MHPLPNETLLEVFRFLPLPSLGLCVALCSTRFQQITDMRILSQRTIEQIVIFEENLGLIEGSKNNQRFREMPIPEVVPPPNIHIKSITIYRNLVGRCANFLRLLSSSRPCTLHLDGSRFIDQFGVRSWPRNVYKLVLVKCMDAHCYDNGRSLFHAFTDPELPILEVPLLECHLSEPDNGQLLQWLDYMPSSSSGRLASRGKRHSGPNKSRLLVLKGDPEYIRQFLRTVRRHFACATAPKSYQVKIECEEELAEWEDRNWATKERLELCKSADNARNCYSLERIQKSGPSHVVDDFWPEHPEMAIDVQMTNANANNKPTLNIIFK